jgi:hypothetical protein
MVSKNRITTIRYSDPEKSFLDKLGFGFQRTFNIGYMALKLLSIQGGTCPVCYLDRSGTNNPPPAGPLHQGLDPAAHCCPSCPVRKAMPKRLPAALQAGKKENDIIEPSRAAGPVGSD